MPKKVAYNATLIARIVVTPKILILRVKPDKEPFDFSPGQFTVLGLRKSEPRIAGADPDEVPPEKMERLARRAYSISSGTLDGDFVEFYVSLVTSGELTPRLFALKEGDRLFMGDKGRGVFTLDKVDSGKSILLVGTGTGLAPYISMVRTMALGEEGCPVRAITIMHGARYSWDLGYRGELEALARACPRFVYLPVVSDPVRDHDWKGRTGRLNDWLVKPELSELCGFDLNPTKTDIFLCGHPGMIQSGIEILGERGYAKGTHKEPGSLHLEKYW
ncbi:MAG: ferredoxin--NADP reductase [Magnetococcales bacterium]|nr:ferredoxin--NADP reductase [Magnetococcales bacterium]